MYFFNKKTLVSQDEKTLKICSESMNSNEFTGTGDVLYFVAISERECTFSEIPFSEILLNET